jgi:hypothetical protein
MSASTQPSNFYSALAQCGSTEPTPRVPLAEAFTQDVQ